MKQVIWNFIKIVLKACNPIAPDLSITLEEAWDLAKDMTERGVEI